MEPVEIFSIDFGSRIVEIHRADDDEGHEPGTAYLLYFGDCKKPKEVKFPIRWNDFFDDALEIIVVDEKAFRLLWEVVSTGQVLH